MRALSLALTHTHTRANKHTQPALASAIVEDLKEGSQVNRMNPSHPSPGPPLPSSCPAFTPLSFSPRRPRPASITLPLISVIYDAWRRQWKSDRKQRRREKSRRRWRRSWRVRLRSRRDKWVSGRHIVGTGYVYFCSSIDIYFSRSFSLFFSWSAAFLSSSRSSLPHSLCPILPFPLLPCLSLCGMYLQVMGH